MAAGVVQKEVVTASGENFTMSFWVPDTGSPDVGAIPLHQLAGSDGAPTDLAALIGALGDDPASAPDAAASTLLQMLRLVASYLSQIEGSALALGQDTAENSLSVVNTEDGFRVDGGQAFTVSVAPTVTAGAYSANDVFGVKMTVAAAARESGGGGVLTGISMFDEGANGLVSTIEVFLFNADPSGSTFTDNGALAIVDADGPKLIASVILDTITDTGDGKFLSARNLNIPYVCVGSDDLFAVAVQRGTWAPDATDGVTFTFHAIRD